MVARLITAASTFIQSYCDRNFSSVTRTDVRDGTGGTKLVLSAEPVSAVSALAIDGLPIPVSTGYGVDGYYFNAYYIGLRNYTFTQDEGNVSVTYTAGYATIPEDLRQATIDLVALKYKQKDRIGVGSKSLAGESVTFLTTDMPDNVKSVLAQYKNVLPI